jgi:hypothetical protein
MTTTDLSLDANRRNAQLSTGPTTTKGKGISRANSVRHGLSANLAAGVIEDAGAFEDLHSELVKHLIPRSKAAWFIASPSASGGFNAQARQTRP